MAVIGYEWIVALVIIAVVFLWGPKKIPELARSIGRVKQEFEHAKSGLSFSTRARKDED